jgi:2-iminobutanoate/2-iminopropanoate deaminase
MWSTALSFAMAGSIFLVVYLFIGARAPEPQRRAINPPGSVEGLPFSNGILAGNTLYVAGQEGMVGGKLASGGIGSETRTALENIERIVKAAGLDMKDVASVTVFLADIHDFPEMNKVYQTYFPDPKPARATVQVAALVNNARVEISAIAVKER